MKQENFKLIVNYLWKNYKNNIMDFDFPNYGNLPKKIYNTLSSESVDAIQYIFDIKCINNKLKFKCLLKSKLFELGELIN